MSNAEDRKRLLREYKQTPPPMGVFAVRNTAEDKVLLGASTNLPGILNRHRFTLEMSGHTSKALQADWNRLGPDAFTFETLDVLEPSDDPEFDPAEDLDQLLAMWVERLGLTADQRY